jgi:hypothetical protein
MGVMGVMGIRGLEPQLTLRLSFMPSAIFFSESSSDSFCKHREETQQGMEPP